jgi:hypothetical protein
MDTSTPAPPAEADNAAQVAPAQPADIEPSPGENGTDNNGANHPEDAGPMEAIEDAALRADDLDNLNLFEETPPREAAPRPPRPTLSRDEYFNSRVAAHLELNGNSTDIALRQGELHYEEWRWLQNHPLATEGLKGRLAYWTRVVEKKYGIPVRSAIFDRVVFEFYTHIQPVERPYLCRTGMTKLSLVIPLHKAGAEKCAAKGVKNLVFTADGISITLVTTDSDGVETDQVYDLADPALTVRMLRERMPQANKVAAESDNETPDQKVKRLQAENRTLKAKVKTLESANLTFQRRTLDAENARVRLEDEVATLRAQLAEREAEATELVEV